MTIHQVMKITDAVAIISNRMLAGAVDRDTATQQVVVLCQQYSRDPNDLAIELAVELARAKSALAAKNRN